MIFKTLSSDALFKNVFFKHHELLTWLVNRTLKDYHCSYSLNNYEIVNCELYKNSVFIKSRTVDMLLESDKKIYNIELNPYFGKEVILRNYIYQSNHLANTVKVGKNYKDNIKPIIQINYNIHSEQNYSGKYTDMEEQCYHKYLFLKEIINVDIAKYMDKWYNLGKDKKYYEKYKHFLILGMNKKELETLEDDDKMVKKIKEEVFNLNNSKKYPKFLTDEEYLEFEKGLSYNMGIEKGIEKGIEHGHMEGIEEGKNEEKRMNAKKMKQENIPLDIIKRITGLDIKIIISL